MDEPSANSKPRSREAFYAFVGRVSLQLINKNIDAITVANFLREITAADMHTLTLEQAIEIAQNYLDIAEDWREALRKSADAPSPMRWEENQKGMQVNEKALYKAKSLIGSRQYVLDSAWEEAQPTAESENAFLARQSWKAYSWWHLGIDPGASEETKGRHTFPFGDFRRVHRSGLIAAKQRASQYGHVEVAKAADALLELLDAKKSS